MRVRSPPPALAVRRERPAGPRCSPHDPGAPRSLPAAHDPGPAGDDHRGRDHPRGDLDRAPRPDLGPDLGLPRPRAQPARRVAAAPRHPPPWLGCGDCLPADTRVLRRDRLHIRPDPHPPERRLRPQAAELRARHHARPRASRLPGDEVPPAGARPARREDGRRQEGSRALRRSLLGGQGIISIVVAAITIGFMTYFMIIEGPAWVDRFYSLLPERSQP